MLIEARKAVFGYGGRPVVRVRELRLSEGACLGMFGPNGSGKTTLVRGLMGLLRPLTGTVDQRPRLRLGYLPQLRTLDLQWPMTGMDAASMAISALRPLGRVRRDATTIRRMMELLGVEAIASRPMAGLSGGQQQRLLLAGALAAGPELLVLDEPTEGLDVRSRQVLLDALRTAATRGLCSILISHTVEDLIDTCVDVAWLHRTEDAEGPTNVEVISVADMADRASGLKVSR